MIIEIIVAMLLGICGGIFTGLLPGVHINLVMAVLVPVLISDLTIEPFTIALGIIALAATHTVLDFIPSIYLGAPEEETALSVLPAHQLLLEGKGHEATLLIIGGVMVALAAVLITSPFFFYVLPSVEKGFTNIIPLALIGISLYMVLREEKPLPAIVCFISAGFLGYAALNLPIKEPLFPLLGGLFGASGLILATKQKTNIPLQQSEIKATSTLKRRDWLKTLGEVVCIGPFCTVLPALGSGYAALIASEITKPARRRFIAIASAMSTYVMATSILVAYTIGKSRTGAAANIVSLAPELPFNKIFILMCAFGIIALGACFLAKKISLVCSRVINRINYGKLSGIVLLFMGASVLIISGPKGVLVLITGAALGIYTLLSKVKRMHLMGCLIIPTIFYYLG